MILTGIAFVLTATGEYLIRKENLAEKWIVRNAG